MAPEYLSSNVMNYLVYRYLNESGYVRAADRLRRSWVGSSASSDPDRLPFAKTVKRHALIDLVQDGLFLDRLESSAKNTFPRFHFGADHGSPHALHSDERIPHPIYHPEKQPSTEREQDPEDENGVLTEAAPPRAQKRKRKSGTERAVNGDPMDIDSADPVQPPTLETSVEPVDVDSRAISPVVPILTTAEIGTENGIQVGQRPKDLLQSTTFIKRPNPIAAIEWSPEHPNVLLSAGTNEAVISAIDYGADHDDIEIKTHELQLPVTGSFEVQNFCWTENGEAVLTVAETPKEVNLPVQTRLVRLRHNGDTEILAPVSGMVYALKYERTMKRLLCLCANNDNSIFHIWRFDPASGGAELIGRKRPEGVHQLYDAAWMNSTQLLVCGVDCVQLYETDTASGVTLSKNFTSPGFSAFRLQREPINGQMAVVIDEHFRQKVLYTTEKGPFKFPEQTQDGGEEKEITDFAFEPDSDAASRSLSSPKKFAISYQDGSLEIWSCALTLKQEVDISLTHTFRSDAQVTISALTFSPDGAFMAVASFDSLTVWRLRQALQNGDSNGVSHQPSSDITPYATWNWISGTSNEWKIPTMEADLDWAQSLKWTQANGSDTIAYAMDDSIAIISV